MIVEIIYRYIHYKGYLSPHKIQYVLPYPIQKWFFPGTPFLIKKDLDYDWILSKLGWRVDDKKKAAFCFGNAQYAHYILCFNEYVKGSKPISQFYDVLCG